MLSEYVNGGGALNRVRNNRKLWKTIQKYQKEMQYSLKNQIQKKEKKS